MPPGRIKTTGFFSYRIYNYQLVFRLQRYENPLRFCLFLCHFVYFCRVPENPIPVAEKIPCFHCGEDCGVSPVVFEEKSFCCSGCMTVYDILSRSNACEYYHLESHPGFRAARSEAGNRFAFLDNEEIRRELLDFSDGGISRAKLFIPSIHCSSCIWLLENLSRLNPGVLQSSVNFVKKEVSVTWKDSELTFRQLAELLASVNYVPHIALDRVEKEAGKRTSRGIYYRLGVAGFCFGNIMLFSFPAYLSVDDAVEDALRYNF
jgi:Cu+-exporting ATPase